MSGHLLAANRCDRLGHRHHLGWRRVEELPLLIDFAECHFAARGGDAFLTWFHRSAVGVSSPPD